MSKRLLRTTMKGSLVAVALLHLGGCVISGPLSLIGIADKILTDTPPVTTSPISIDELLQRARSTDSSDQAVFPTAVVEQGVGGMDGAAYVALGEFLTKLPPGIPHTLNLTRAPGTKEDLFTEAQFAIEVGRLLEAAGHKVHITVSPNQSKGKVLLSVDQGEAA